MTLDAGPVGRITAELMEEIESAYPDAVFEDAVVVVEVSFPGSDGSTVTAGRYRSTTHRASATIGMLELTLDRMREPFVQGDDDEDAE